MPAQFKRLPPQKVVFPRSHIARVLNRRDRSVPLMGCSQRVVVARCGPLHQALPRSNRLWRGEAKDPARPAEQCEWRVTNRGPKKPNQNLRSASADIMVEPIKGVMRHPHNRDAATLLQSRNSPERLGGARTRKRLECRKGQHCPNQK